MSKEFYIRLTLGVYKVSQLFPEKVPGGNPLKTDFRELADKILVSLLTNQYENSSRTIEEMGNLLNLAESRGLADPRNFSVLRREYAKIEDLCVENMGKTVPARIGYAEGVAGGENSPKKTKKRQKVILSILKNNGKVKIGDLAKSFPDINRRTLLRDMGVFCQTGVIERIGNGRGACYNIKNATLYKEMSQLA